MKLMKILASGVLCALLAGTGLMLMSGCEDEGSTDIPEMSSFSSNPRVTGDEGIMTEEYFQIRSTELFAGIAYVGQTVSLTIEGGSHPFTWGVANSSIGTVAQLDNGRDAIYTVKEVAPNTVTVTDGEVRSDTMSLTVEGGTLPFQVIPSDLTLSSGSTNKADGTGALFGMSGTVAANGGVPPYTFKAQYPAWVSVDQKGRWEIVTLTLPFGSYDPILVSDSSGQVLPVRFNIVVSTP